MNSVMGKVSVVALAGMIAIALWYGILPYVKGFQQGGLEKQIQIHVNSNDPKPITLTSGTTTITVEIVSTDRDKEKGLGGRYTLDENAGMLFTFDQPQYVAIWMKGMFFPIDIAWLDKSFNVIDIKSNVSPNTYPTTFSPHSPASYVIEVNADFFKEHQIGVGSSFHFDGN